MNHFIDKIGQRYVIHYLHSKGLSPTNIKAELDSTLGKSKYGVVKLKRRMSCQDEHRIARPIELATLQNQKSQAKGAKAR